MDFLIALFGAVVGGFVSIATTAFFQWRSDIKVRKALASSLTFRLLECAEDLHKIRTHIFKSIHDEKGNRVPRARFSERVQQMLGGSTEAIAYEPSELSILHKNEHNELVMKLIEVIRARNISVEMLAQFNAMKKELDEVLVGVGRFEKQGEELRLRAEFDLNERPDIGGKIHKANLVIEQLYEMAERAFADAHTCAHDLATALPVYFPNRTDLKKLKLPEIENRQD